MCIRDRFPSDQKVIYASMKAGSEPEIAMPYNTGYEVDAENQQVSYYYRDDAAFVDGTLKDMTVSVDVDGTEYPMTYNDTTKRFEYVKNGLTTVSYTHLDVYKRQVYS